MNIDTRIDRAQGLRTHVIHGEIKLPEIKTYLTTFYDSLGFNPLHHALWDVRGAAFPAVTQEEIKELASFVRIHWKEAYRRKVAVVVSADFHFGLSRMFEQFVGLSPHARIRTFREIEPALDWIKGKASVSPLPPQG